MQPTRRNTFLTAAAIVIAGAAAYANGLDTPFVFDDTQYVAGNPAIRTLWPPFDWLAFCPTRPLVYFTFAVNYALGGENVRGYHVVNLAIHLATALALFGLARRTFRLPTIAERHRVGADCVAGAIALIWVAHPLGSQAVTYVYQRLESLAALFCVLCLYAFVRAYGEASVARLGWAVASAVFCLAAMLSKESAAGLPLIVLIYDRLFLGDRWNEVRRHRYVHAATFSSWGVAACLIAVTGSAYGKAGIGAVDGATPLTYLLSQSGVILRYLRLSFWPSGQCIDYGWPIADEWHEFVPQGIVVLALLGATIVGLVCGRLWSFPACAFFLLLAPTSSVVPIGDLIFEHRMYLPLAAVVTLAVCASVEALDRLSQRPVFAMDRRTLRLGLTAATLSVVGLLGVVTRLRNHDYASELTLWHDIIAKAPTNPRGYFLLGRHYEERRQRVDARRYLEQSIAANPDYLPALARLAAMAADERRFDEAEGYVERIAQVTPDTPLSFVRYGALRAAQGRNDEAAAYFSQVLLVEPDNVEALAGLAAILASAGRNDEAGELYRSLTAAEPDDPSHFNNLGVIYGSQGRLDEAVAAFRHALELRPWHVEARVNLGGALDMLGQGDEGLHELLRAVADDGEYLGARISLGNALARRGRLDEAIVQYREVLRIDPANAQAAANLAQALSDQAAALSPRS
jgi:protein O-mannosyl-transferase